MNKIITFIGAGNMARSLIAGLIQDDTQHNIRISDPDESQLQAIQQNWSNVEAFSDNVEAISRRRCCGAGSETTNHAACL